MRDDSDQTEGRRLAHGEADAMARRDEAMSKHRATLKDDKRETLAKMLEAWAFWSELEPTLRSELLDCIEYTYRDCTVPPADRA